MGGDSLGTPLKRRKTFEKPTFECLSVLNECFGDNALSEITADEKRVYRE